MTIPVYSCGSFTPGHDVHYIQALRSANDAENPPTPGKLVDISADGTLVVEIDNEQLRLWNHDPSRLERLVSANAGQIIYRPDWGLLGTASGDGHFLFCVALAADDRRACPTTPATGSAIDRLQQRGGFILSGAAARELFGTEPGDHKVS